MIASIDRLFDDHPCESLMPITFIIFSTLSSTHKRAFLTRVDKFPLRASPPIQRVNGIVSSNVDVARNALGKTVQHMLSSSIFSLSSNAQAL